MTAYRSPFRPWRPAEREQFPLRPGFRRNPGRCPDEAVGKRVLVAQMTGELGRADDNPMSPAGWAADGRGGCAWTLDGSPWNIDQYRVI